MYGTFVVKFTRNTGDTAYLESFTPNLSDPAMSTYTLCSTAGSAKKFESDTASDSTGLFCQAYSNGDITGFESVKVSDKMPNR